MTGMCEVSLLCLTERIMARHSACRVSEPQMTMSGCICLSSSVMAAASSGILMLYSGAKRSATKFMISGLSFMMNIVCRCLSNSYSRRGSSRAGSW